MIEILTGIIILVGTFFCVSAAIGMVRLPDIYSRMHAASKAGTLGSGLLLLSIAIQSGELEIITRAIAGIIFFMLTTPVSSHLLARAAYFAGIKPWSRTYIDHLRNHYKKSEYKLEAYDFDK